MVLEDSVDLLRNEKFEQVEKQLNGLYEKCKSMNKTELKRTATQTVKALNAIVAFGGTVTAASSSAQALSIANTAISTLELFQPVLVSKASDFVKLHFNLCVKTIEAKQVCEFEKQKQKKTVDFQFSLFCSMHLTNTKKTSFNF